MSNDAKRTSAPVSLGRTHLLPVVAEFLATFPEVDVQLSFQDRAVNLLEEHVDLALRIGALADSSLIAARIGEVHRVVCASPTYLKSRGSPKSPEDLSKHDCITQSPSTWTFMQGETEYVVPVRSCLLVSNLESACDAARAGIGIAVLFSYIVAEMVKSGKLTPLLQDFQPAPRPISFVYSPNRFMPVKLRAFLDFAIPRLRLRLGDLPKALAPRKGLKAQ